MIMFKAEKQEREFCRSSDEGDANELINWCGLGAKIGQQCATDCVFAWCGVSEGKM